MRFSIISEGSTDFRVLKTIIECIFADSEVNCLVPVLDATTLKTAKDEHGTWTKIPIYLKSNFLEDALVNTDFLVIQIDTDVCEEPGFDVLGKTLADSNQEKFYDLIKEKIIEWIDSYEAETYSFYQEKFIFAIAIHSLECWLLAYYCKNSELKNKRIKNGFEHLQRVLQRDKKIQLSEPKDPNVYEELSKPFRKRKFHTKGREYSYSLDKFITTLEIIEKNI
ncbi:hypothetical protein RFY44_18725 [Acinetobacter bereziniae]|uniref:hypothetical protein n=1 Tax=Acinetobacter bereziniae TaxID=106648 RepID=UPI00281390B2|nr:hypothetical protein [Acinetobacter bereziniae]MDQ9820888.1 hypothetical protein [Acinetobacter bereziniae]